VAQKNIENPQLIQFSTTVYDIESGYAIFERNNVASSGEVGEKFATAVLYFEFATN
jgi:hypothetical protein